LGRIIDQAVANASGWAEADEVMAALVEPYGETLLGKPAVAPGTGETFNDPALLDEPAVAPSGVCASGEAAAPE
jgi:hypothetical protein